MLFTFETARSETPDNISINLREITFRLTNVIPERIIFVSRGITVLYIFLISLIVGLLISQYVYPCNFVHSHVTVPTLDIYILFSTLSAHNHEPILLTRCTSLSISDAKCRNKNKPALREMGWVLEFHCNVTALSMSHCPYVGKDLLRPHVRVEM